MEFKIKSKNMEIDDKIRQYAEKKIKDRVVKFLDKVIEIELKLTFEKNPRITENNLAEVTIYTAGTVIRAEDSGVDTYSAIDKVNEKLERQVKKFKDKRIQRGRHQPNKSNASVDQKIRNQIVKTKTFIMKPMTPEEAVMQMELIGHDFFVFISSETGETAVVYKRKDRNYGLIEPTIE